jgi:hypothetical protein
VRYNPAGLALPSPIQGHATVLAGVIAAVALLAVGAWFLYHGVGPFRAELVNRSVDTGSRVMVVDLKVYNEGDRSGRARCRLSGIRPDGSLVNSGVQLTQSIPGHGDVMFRVRGEDMSDAHDVNATCS